MKKFNKTKISRAPKPRDLINDLVKTMQRNCKHEQTKDKGSGITKCTQCGKQLLN